jgi:uncharacterized membrane protein YbaN (DUF454 family)
MRVAGLLYNFLGFVTLGLGLTGVALPLLPTTPFLLLACFCFARGSARFHNWLVNRWFYKRYLSGFVKTRGMTVRAKLTICMTATLLVAIPFIFAPFWAVRLLIICAMVFKWCYFIFGIKTISSEGQEGRILSEDKSDC